MFSVFGTSGIQHQDTWEGTIKFRNIHFPTSNRLAKEAVGSFEVQKWSVCTNAEVVCLRNCAHGHCLCCRVRHRVSTNTSEVMWPTTELNLQLGETAPIAIKIQKYQNCLQLQSSCLLYPQINQKFLQSSLIGCFLQWLPICLCWKMKPFRNQLQNHPQGAAGLQKAKQRDRFVTDLHWHLALAVATQECQKTTQEVSFFVWYLFLGQTGGNQSLLLCFGGQ